MFKLYVSKHCPHSQIAIQNLAKMNNRVDWLVEKNYDFDMFANHQLTAVPALTTGDVFECDGRDKICKYLKSIQLSHVQMIMKQYFVCTSLPFDLVKIIILF